MKDLKESLIILEFVLIGFQALIWVSFLILAVFGYQWLNLSGLKEWSPEISVALVGVAYMFGVIFDKAIGALPFGWAAGEKVLEEMEESPSRLQMRMGILVSKPDVYEILEKRINEHRLVRATVLNLALISLSALTFFALQLRFTPRLLIVFFLLSALFVGLTLFTGRRSAETLDFELFYAYKATKALTGAGSGEGEAPPSS